MHNQEATGLGVSYEVVRCAQPANTVRHVVSTLANPLPTVCPDGRPIKKLIMGRVRYQQTVAAEIALQDRSNKKHDPSHEPVFFFYREMPPTASTLYPAQMRMITQPFCNSANQRYINCVQNVYRTREIEGCAVVPDYCQTSDFLQ
jgi:hypothetical protein